MSSVRVLKVKQTMHQAMQDIFFKMREQFSISDLHISADLRVARFELNFLATNITEKKAISNLNKKMFLIKKMLKNYIDLKYFPEIHFVSDRHKNRIASIEKLFETILVE